MLRRAEMLMGAPGINAKTPATNLTRDFSDGITTRSASACLQVRDAFRPQQEAAMSEQETKLDRPDFALGVPLEDLAEGKMILGHVAGEAVVLARTDGAFFAIDAECTHYHGPLADGMLVADTVRCPWHHACFSLRTGEALRAPALNPVSCWRVEQQDGKIFVREKLEPAEREARAAAGGGPEAIVIIGG